MRPRVCAAVLAVACAPGCGRAASEPAEVLVPAGKFRAGATCLSRPPDPSCDSAYRGDGPHGGGRATVHLDAFYADRRLATRAEFAQCIFAGACGYALRPVSPETYERYGAATVDRYVASATLAGARAYCRWRGGRLQTADQFERLARGTDGRIEPWRTRPWSCPWNDSYADGCTDYKGPAGARAVAYSPQWVDDDDPHYPGGVIRGDGSIAYAASNRDQTLMSPSWTPIRYAGIRCTRPADAPAPPPDARAPQ